MKQLSKISPQHPRGGGFVPPPWEICPAKSSPFKTLQRHAQETGAVFKALCRFLHLREDLLPPSALLFAMGHDCGKLSPGFISKLPGGFAGKNGIPETREFQRHEVISESAFRTYLKSRSDSCETIVGWHHGRRNPSVQEEGACDYGGEAWQVRRREFLDWIFSFASLPANSFSSENRLLSAGVVCLADWIASNETFFPEDQTELPLEGLEQAAVKVLEKIGADLVIFPEQEMALSLARRLINGDILNFIELSDEYSIVERTLPDSWVGKSIVELNIRARWKLTVIAVRRGEEMTIAPGGDFVFQSPEDCLVVLGRNSDIERLERV